MKGRVFQAKGQRQEKVKQYWLEMEIGEQRIWLEYVGMGWDGPELGLESFVQTSLESLEGHAYMLHSFIYSMNI